MKNRRTRSQLSRADRTAKVVLAGLIALAALPPLLWAAISVLQTKRHLHEVVHSVAWLAQRGAEGQRWLAVPPFEVEQERRELIGADQKVLAAEGAPITSDWLALSVRHELPPAAGRASAVQASRSLAATLASSLLVLLASAGLAFGLWSGAFRRPMAALRRAEVRVLAMAHVDALTGLLNRDGLRSQLQRALGQVDGSRRTVGVLLIDLDRFRVVNDTLGQPAGDALLRGVADRMRAVTRDGDVLARLGADQFAIQVRGISGNQALIAMARNLLRAFEPPYALDGRDTIAMMSIGVAVAGEQAGTVDELLSCADAAMRSAKASGGGRFRVYEPEMQVDPAMRLDMPMRLKRAFQANEFFVVYQPIVEADGREIIAVESLLRWQDPQRGEVMPSEFIPAMEQTGLIVQVGRWVLEQSCRCGVAWMREGVNDLVLSVNVSPRQFAEADFVQTVADVLSATGFPAQRLQLEVTEGLLLDPTPQSLEKLDRLAASGVRLAVDDFGMGYSSLAYLKRFRLHTLKIDRMFVRDIPMHQQDAAIVRAIVDLGHGLGLRVTAEGVEKSEQFHELRRLGCDSMQGYLFSRPVSAPRMGQMLAQPPLELGGGRLTGAPTTMAAPLDAIAPA